MSDKEAPLICIVEDDQPVRQSLVALVTSAGYQAATFADAESFLATNSVAKAAFLIVDVRLPAMSGIDLLHQLRSTGANPRAVILTGHADSAELRKSKLLDDVQLLSKPAAPEELLDLISAAVIPDAE